MYGKLVVTRATNLEALLKLVATPEDMLAERFHILWPNGMANDLVLVMNLKGIKRSDQQKVLDALALHAPPGGSDGEELRVNTAKDGAAFGIHSGNSSGGSASSSTSFASTFSSVPQVFTSGLSAASQSSASMMSSSMRFLSQDLGITSTARSAVGNLKWSSTTSSTTK